MTVNETMLPFDDAKELVLAVIEHLAQWPMPSAEAFRNAMLGGGMLAVNPMLDITKEEEAHFLRDCIGEAVEDGKMIDFGYIPNEIMRAESRRNRTMYEAGDLPSPYPDWLAVASWEGGFNGYYFSTNPTAPGETLCVELYGVRIPAGHWPHQNRGHIDVVLIYDIVKVNVLGIDNTEVSPAKLINKALETDLNAQALRAANCIDPLVTMLRLLSDASVPIVNHPAPDRLNKLRVRQGKQPIPAHSVVVTKDYVSMYHAAKSAKGATKNGHHASPVAHSRRAHLRHLASGKVIHVRDSKVNWRSSEDLHRLFYRVPKVS